MNRIRLGVASLIFASVIVFLAFRGDARQATPVEATPSDSVIPGLLTFDVPSAAHVQGPVEYPQTPPVGGPHNPVWQDCGFYDQPVGNEHAVHSLEHGVVWITYRLDLPADQVALLRELAAQDDHILVSPYPGLPAPIVASAWGKQLWLERADDPRLGQFIDAFIGKGPEGRASCSGGTTATLAIGSPVAGTPQPHATPSS
ncbi:MAG: hypothetical protein QOJ59_1561 [Thermomicrobiales bacterium]|nr:hypothetical protein [Thermomicrobiales bacterium]